MEEEKICLACFTPSCWKIWGSMFCGLPVGQGECINKDRTLWFFTKRQKHFFRSGIVN